MIKDKKILIDNLYDMLSDALQALEQENHKYVAI